MSATVDRTLPASVAETAARRGLGAFLDVREEAAVRSPGVSAGPRVNYLYEGGIVQRRRSAVSVIAWPDLIGMSPLYGRSHGHEGEVLAYRLDGRDGTSFAVAVILADNRDPFLDQAIEHVRGNGGVIG